MSVKEVAKEVVTKVEEEVDSFTQNKALEVLVQAVKLAQKRGAYELEETEIILKAIKKFVQQTV